MVPTPFFGCNVFLCCVYFPWSPWSLCDHRPRSLSVTTTLVLTLQTPSCGCMHIYGCCAHDWCHDTHIRFTLLHAAGGAENTLVCTVSRFWEKQFPLFRGQHSAPRGTLFPCGCFCLWGVSWATCLPPFPTATVSPPHTCGTPLRRPILYATSWLRIKYWCLETLSLLLAFSVNDFVLGEFKILDLAFWRYAIGVAPLPMPFWEGEKLRVGFRIWIPDPGLFHFSPKKVRSGPNQF